MRVLGIDYGDRRIGLAISDEESIIVHGLPLLEYEVLEDALERLVELIQERQVQEVVVGLPRNMNDTIGPRARIVLDFVEQLKGRVSVPIVTWDERLTTVQAAGMLGGVKMSRQKKRDHLNTVSAQIILESYLEAKKRKGLLSS